MAVRLCERHHGKAQLDMHESRRLSADIIEEGKLDESANADAWPSVCHVMSLLYSLHGTNAVRSKTFSYISHCNYLPRIIGHG